MEEVATDEIRDDVSTTCVNVTAVVCGDGLLMLGVVGWLVGPGADVDGMMALEASPSPSSVGIP